jgi:DNA-binding CsgD family transcriptional regulator
MAVTVRAEGHSRTAHDSPSHRALAARIVATLDECRSLMKIAVVEDDELHRLRALSRDELYEAARVLEATIDAVTERLRTTSRGTRKVTVLRVNELLAALHTLLNEIQRTFLERQAEMLGGIAEALHRLRGVESTSQMIERVTAEVCRSCGVDRCAVLRSDGASLILESVHFAEDPEWQEEWAAFARSHPPILDPRDREVQLLRRRIPILVEDAASTSGMREITAEAARSVGYVAAPLIVRGSVIGTLHADRYFSGSLVDPVALNTVAAFAAGFGYALERTVLMDRTSAQLRRMRSMLAETESSIDELFSTGVSLRRDQRGSITPEARGPALGFPGASRLSSLLTRRELEVVDLMARGASNGDIATELVISEGTVKSHVKHILRKMHAANRAQAVSTYVRIQALSKAA